MALSFAGAGPERGWRREFRECIDYQRWLQTFSAGVDAKVLIGTIHTRR